MEKITSKVRCLSAKLPSYAGRLQLIKSVIFGFQTFWAQIFLLPKRILKMIDAICRSFLWTGQAEASRKSLVSWQKIGSPKSAGGQNIMNIHLWNQAALLKLLWSVKTKKGCLWIKWLHEYYIKNALVEICVIPVTATWVLRKIVESRRYIAQLHTILGGFEAKLKSVVSNGKFSITKMYHLLLPTYQKVEWKSIALQRHIHPQYRFILWLAA